MAFEKQLPEWKEKGMKPPQNKLDEGWKAQDKPPAAWLNWQMNSTYEALNELQQHAVDGRDVSAVPSANSIVRLDGEGHLNEQALANAKSKAIQFKPGVQVIESDIDTSLKVESITGRTLVNLFGSNGDMKNISWLRPYDARISIDTTVADTGGHCLKIIAGNDAAQVTKGGVAYVADMPFKSGKNYVAIARIKNGTGIHAYMNIPGHDATSKLILNRDRFEIVWLKFRPTFDTTTNFDIVVNGTNGVNAYCDSMRMYEISDEEFAALDGLSSDDIAERYPYVDGMTNVTNPYVIVKSENLLPPFTDWGNMHAGIKLISELFSFTMKTAAKDEASVYMPAKVGDTYTLSATHSGRIGVNAWDAMGNTIGTESVVPYTSAQTVTFTLPVGTVQMSVHFGNVIGEGVNDYLKSCDFKNPLLTIGSTPIPFQPQKRSMWAVEAQLAANPITGAAADVLYTGDDGIPYVLEKWEKVTLDASITYRHADTGAGYKTIFTESLNPTKKDTAFVTKYDGKMLHRKLQGEMITAADEHVLTDAADPNANILVFSVSNSDSGWGDAYTPTTDEIKAYFDGWKMYASNGSPTLPYNRTDGTLKMWCYRHPKGADGLAGGTSTVPAEQAPINELWTPYRLQYLKALPSVVPVENYETGAVLAAGSNVVEVGSGIVIREKAQFTKGTAGENAYYWNSKAYATTSRHPVAHIWHVYANSTSVRGFVRSANSDAHGMERAAIWAAEYDPTSTYSATYTMLVPTIAATINVKAAANIRGTVAELVGHVGDVERRLTVVETQSDNKKSHWIKLTSLNGWVNNAGFEAAYRREKNTVYVIGGLALGTTAKETSLLKIPRVDAPDKRTSVSAVTFDINAVNTKAVQLILETNGNLYIDSSSGTAGQFIHFNFSYISEVKI
ncbi:hypothetical protein NQ117_10945 [Paenibacillus sp. SC116]|uniref:hypothetical protein n=1 Tax=Paenibacillus sp. SC116 TaxID=2968986 RepID=UPI00215B284D|nr:hypothetical protein [Paenibacillus sp. SC116]MCR8844202.1 hypothetical protein [Paenibacillus sp. SC116]